MESTPQNQLDAPITSYTTTLAIKQLTRKRSHPVPDVDLRKIITATTYKSRGLLDKR